MGIRYTRIIDKKKYVNQCDVLEKYACEKILSFIDFEGVSIEIDGKIENIKILCKLLSLKLNTKIDMIIISLYLKYGNKGIYHLKGNFSLVLYDKNKDLTLLYSNFLTGYSLYYVYKNNLFTASTNPIELLYRSDVSTTLNKEEMSACFSLNLSRWSHSFFSELNEVKNGEMVIITSKGIYSTKQALNEIFVAFKQKNEDAILENYKKLLNKSVTKHIIADKNYGIMLSSGMDSSSLAYYASRELKKQDKILNIYSWYLPNYEADESKKIKELASSFGMKLNLFNGEDFAPFSNLNSPLKPDIPFTNMYDLLFLEIYKRASKDGIDILFNGHYGDTIYPEIKNIFIEIVRDKQFSLFIPTLQAIVKRLGYKKAFHHPAIRNFIKSLVPFYTSSKLKFKPLEWLSDEANDTLKKVVNHKRKETFKAFESFEFSLSRQSSDYGWGRYLTSPYNLERIEPFRDIDLINHTLRLPSYMNYRHGQTKYFAREAMKGLLPESVRTQGRVGLLNKFAMDGFYANKEKVRERLFDEKEPWKIYIKEEWMEKQFKKNAELEDKDLLIISMCVNLARWQRAIKKGGELYEGTFMENNFLK